MLEKILNSTKKALAIGTTILATSLYSPAQPTNLDLMAASQKNETCEVISKRYQLLQNGKKIPSGEKENQVGIYSENNGEFNLVTVIYSAKNDDEELVRKDEEYLNVTKSKTYFIVPEGVSIDIVGQNSFGFRRGENYQEELVPLEETENAIKVQEFGEKLLNSLKEQNIYFENAIDIFIDSYRSLEKNKEDQFLKENSKVIPVVYWPIDETTLGVKQTREIARTFKFRVNADNYFGEKIPITIYQKIVSQNTEAPLANKAMLQSEAEWISMLEIPNKFEGQIPEKIEGLEKLLGFYKYQGEGLFDFEFVNAVIGITKVAEESYKITLYSEKDKEELSFYLDNNSNSLDFFKENREKRVGMGKKEKKAGRFMKINTEAYLQRKEKTLEFERRRIQMIKTENSKRNLILRKYSNTSATFSPTNPEEDKYYDWGKYFDHMKKLEDDLHKEIFGSSYYDEN